MTSPAVEPPEAVAEPVSPARPSPTGVVREAWHLILRYPRSMLLPMLLVQVILAVVTASTSATLYLTVFSDEPYPEGGLYGVEELGAPAFVFAMLLALNALFALVAQGATVVATARAEAGRPASLVEALDPAFTRMGALLALTIVILGGVSALVLTIVGIVALPYFVLRFGLAYNTLMLEGCSPAKALTRSWRMTHGNILRFGAVLLLTVAILLPLIVVRGLPLTPVDETRGVRITIDTVRIVVESFLTVPFAVLASAATTVFYLRLRENNGEPAPRV